MMSINYQKKLDEILELPNIQGKKLLIHCCCAPCSSYVLEYLGNYFSITVLYYNPNITSETEYCKRVKEQKRLIDAFNAQKKCKYPIDFVEGNYEPTLFFDAVKGHEKDKEGGERCGICFELRLKEAARYAAKSGYDYFTTSLTISPLKDAERLNAIGEACGKEVHVPFLPSDFKKKNGYKRSIELSKEYDLYRQNFCGCVFSQNEK
ncbi:MAG: epoxyqueuosine reductase QueH [Lachnospiraceae bacterium]|nr:epoxyqueuosine reductase QueH [Lachnospiraceae bacterium]